MKNPCVRIPPTFVQSMDDNPNVMEPEEFDRLKQIIETMGFLQPILVRHPKAESYKEGHAVSEDDGQFTIIDGEHRLQAAKDLGLQHVPAVLTDQLEENAKALRIGMNRIRGELDLTAVSKQMDSLLDIGWSVEDLSVTGFDEDEIQKLIESVAPSDPVLDAIIAQGNVEEPEPVEEEKTRSYAMRLAFSSSVDRERVKEALKNASAGTGDMAVGLLAIVEGLGDE